MWMLSCFAVRCPRIRVWLTPKIQCPTHSARGLAAAIALPYAWGASRCCVVMGQGARGPRASALEREARARAQQRICIYWLACHYSCGDRDCCAHRHCSASPRQAFEQVSKRNVIRKCVASCGEVWLGTPRARMAAQGLLRRCGVVLTYTVIRAVLEHARRPHLGRGPRFRKVAVSLLQQPQLRRRVRLAWPLAVVWLASLGVVKVGLLFTLAQRGLAPRAQRTAPRTLLPQPHSSRSCSAPIEGCVLDRTSSARRGSA